MQHETSDLVRALRESPEVRTNGDSGVTMHGHFARFGEWAEINSAFEGRFMETVQAGAFAKTIREQRNAMKVLLEHGADPDVGNKPLGPIIDLEEDGEGARYAVALLDTDYTRNLIPALRADLYGASFRFSVHRDEWEQEPSRSDHNPDGLPERTLREVGVHEFGPVTFPAYEGATAGVRSVSMTDEWRTANKLAIPEPEIVIPEPEPDPFVGKTPAEREAVLRSFQL